MAGRAPIIPTPKQPTKSVLLEEQIRQRAHEIYLQRGGESTGELDDWLQAEEEIYREKEDRGINAGPKPKAK